MTKHILSTNVGTCPFRSIIIIVTEFDAMTGVLTRFDIRGKGGASLRKRRHDGPSSYEDFAPG